MPSENKYDLEERTLKFAVAVRKFIRLLRKDICNIEDAKQLARSSGSVGANYIEANEALGQKDFLMRLRISRKEAKESKYWLFLIETFNDKDLDTIKQVLINESDELLKIFSAIIRNAQKADAA